MSKSCRIEPASFEDYAKFLAAYVMAGGKIGHYLHDFDYEMANEDLHAEIHSHKRSALLTLGCQDVTHKVYKAIEDGCLGELKGHESIKVIVTGGQYFSVAGDSRILNINAISSIQPKDVFITPDLIQHIQSFGLYLDDDKYYADDAGQMTSRRYFIDGREYFPSQEEIEKYNRDDLVWMRNKRQEEKKIIKYGLDERVCHWGGLPSMHQDSRDRERVRAPRDLIFEKYKSKTNSSSENDRYLFEEHEYGRSLREDSFFRLHEDEVFLSIAFKPATPEQYAEFLMERLRAKGTITHMYNYPFERAKILIAQRDAIVPSGCGSDAWNVIVPFGLDVSFSDPDRNHGNLYKMDDPLIEKMWWVPCYPDVYEIMEKQYLNDVRLPKFIANDHKYYSSLNEGKASRQEYRPRFSKDGLKL